MLLHQPRQELLTSWAALASGVKDGWHHAVKEEAQWVSSWGSAIFPALGGFLGTKVRLDICKHGGGGDPDIHTYGETSEVMKDSVSGVGGSGARRVAHGLNMYGLLDAG
eukprot:3828525-Amphidinium_carterae.5